jgi:hypothetical protein
MKYTHIIAVLIFTFCSNSAFAQRGSGLKLLEIAPTASELALSETRFGVPSGASSIYSNPALLALTPTSSINLSYTNWVADATNLFGGINLRNENRAVAFGFYSSGVNGIEQYDQPGTSNGTFSIQYLSISGALAYEFKYFTIGASAQYLNENIYLYEASGYAINVGLAQQFWDNRITFGVAATNIGEMDEINEDPTELPTSIGIGFSASVLELTHQKNKDLPIKVSVMADYVVPIEENSTDRYTDFNPDEAYLNAGISLLVAETVEISGGFKTGDNTRPYSFGLGFITEKVNFNYAIIPFNTGFGTVHSVGIHYKL